MATQCGCPVLQKGEVAGVTGGTRAHSIVFALDCDNLSATAPMALSVAVVWHACVTLVCYRR
eukprot:9075463-Prorocentrum_lima.AAC.1